MSLLPLSFFAGILTVLSPCVFTLLPVILGGAVENVRKRNPFIIIASLGVSIFVFTMLLKVSTAFIMIPPGVWSFLAGGLLLMFGISALFPTLWGKLNVALKLGTKSDSFLQKASAQEGILGDILIGMALGPVFSSCSPTYTLIIATVLPQNFVVGIINLVAYVVGLCLVLLLVALFGQRIVKKLKWAVNPNGNFKRVVAVIFIVLGLMIIFGIDKQIETFFVNNGSFGIIQFEQNLLPK